MRRRWRSGAMVAGLVAVAPFLPGCRSQPPPAPAAPPSAWQPVRYRESSVIGVGDSRLALPIVLPAGVTPFPTGYAFPATTTSVAVQLFFPEDQEFGLRDWAQNIADRSPIPAGYLRGEPALTIATSRLPGPWRAEMRARTSRGTVTVVAAGFARQDPGPLAGDAHVQTMVRLAGEPGSPVTGTRVIGLFLETRTGK